MKVSIVQNIFQNNRKQAKKTNLLFLTDFHIQWYAEALNYIDKIIKM